MNRWFPVCAIALVLVGAQSAQAQFQASDARRTSLKGGLGFTVDPDAFLLGFEFDQPLQSSVSFIGRLDLAFDDNDFIISPSIGARYWFDLSRTSLGGLRPLRPYVDAGLGFTYLDEDHNNHDEGFGMLIPLGFGAEWPVSREVSLGTDFHFNIIPVGADRQSFYFAWQVLGVRYRF
jgi:hypothetical protein